jgi:hypothetical protein
VKVAATVVEFTTTTLLVLTRVPDRVTAVAPAKLVPLSVKVELVPRLPVAGLTELSVGGGGAVTVNATVLLVPFGVMTLTFLPETFAVPAIVKVAVTVVEFTTAKPVTVTPTVPPPGLVTLTDVAPVKFVPVRVTETVEPRVPILGLIEVSVGSGGAVTVNVTPLLVPPGVLMVTFLAVLFALAEMVKVIVTVVEFTTVGPLTVTPVPETVTAVAPVRLVPLSVTGTTAPCVPVFGEIKDNVGGGVEPWNSTAPTSIGVPGAAGLGLPK